MGIPRVCKSLDSDVLPFFLGDGVKVWNPRIQGV